jgi:hypothetical protein
MSRKGLAAMLTCLGVLGAAPSAHATVREVGLAQPFPAASCPDNCQAIGRVSGFQTQLGEARNPYRVGREGKIVAFTIRLGNPNPEQIQFFDGLFGRPASARLSILRPEPTRRRPNLYRLTGQSEVFNVTPYFGSTPSFVLAPPLTVYRRYVVALTVPTWVPAFAVGLGQDQAWRSSRARGACDDVSQPATHQTRGTLIPYGCFYRTARLLYSATFVPKPTPTTEDRRQGGR